MVSCSKLKKQQCKTEINCEWLRNKGCKKICPKGKEINPDTDRCKKMKECPPGTERNPVTKRCKKIKSTKPCPSGKERDPVTKRCRKIRIKRLPSLSLKEKDIKKTKIVPIQCPEDFVLLPDGINCQKVNLIGSGSYGCVIEPPISEKQYILQTFLQYDNKSNDDISKIFINGKRSFKEELRFLYFMKKIDNKNEFTVQLKAANKFTGLALKNNITLQNCLELKNIGKKNLYQIILENGGVNIDKVNTKIPFQSFIALFRTFLQGMIILKNNKIVHQDIKPTNVLYKQEKISLIDFGLACDAKKLYTLMNNDRLSHRYEFYPPEFYICHLMFKYNVNDNQSLFKDLLKATYNLMKSNDQLDKEFLFFNTDFMDIQDFKKEYRNTIYEFLQEIYHKQIYKIDKIFTEELAYKSDIYGIAHVISCFSFWIDYADTSQKLFIKNIFLRCIDGNPYRRISIEELFKLVEEEYNYSIRN